MKITKRQIQATLRESVFTPRDPGPLKAIIDVGSRDYYAKRAIEIITYYLENGGDKLLTRAITLLALAKLCGDENGN